MKKDQKPRSKNPRKNKDPGKNKNAGCEEELKRQTQAETELEPPTRRPATAVAAVTPPPPPPRARPSELGPERWEPHPGLVRLLRTVRSALGTILDAADSAAEVIVERFGRRA